MRAMRLERLSKVEEGSAPLAPRDLPEPEPAPGELLVDVHTCAVCHTELDEIEGRSAPPRLPVVPGHQVVGTVAANGPGAYRFRVGERVGVAWIFSACGECERCRAGLENLCEGFRATGRDADGGYAERMTVDQRFAYRIPETLADAAAAPLLCAGAIGYRSLRLTGLADGQRLGLTGFGASAHLVLKMARHRFPASEVYVFARQPEEREFALQLGAAWAGDTAEPAPAPLHAIIDTTPAWRPVTAALAALAPGGRLVINAIAKQDADREVLAQLDYPSQLWLEKEVKSVANVTRGDVEGLLALAAEMGLEPAVEEFPLAEANRALVELAHRRVRGAKVLRIA